MYTLIEEALLSLLEEALINITSPYLEKAVRDEVALYDEFLDELSQELGDKIDDLGDLDAYPTHVVEAIKKIKKAQLKAVDTMINLVMNKRA